MSFTITIEDRPPAETTASCDSCVPCACPCSCVCACDGACIGPGAALCDSPTGAADGTPAPRVPLSPLDD